jgi:hypothetical protein
MRTVGHLTVSKLADAQPDELVLCSVKRHTRRTWGWSDVAHICTVDHRYGPTGDLLYVRPICGGAPGRAGSASHEPVCKRCEKKAAS